MEEICEQYAGQDLPLQKASLLQGAEEGDAIQVGNVRFSKSGAPLVLSVKYRNEDLTKIGTCFAIADAAGKLFDLKSTERSGHEPHVYAESTGRSCDPKQFVLTMFRP